MDVIKNADWLIELGPEAGDGGGELVYAGKPAAIKSIKNSYTGRFINWHPLFYEYFLRKYTRFSGFALIR